MNWVLLQNSFLASGMTTVIAVVFGLAAALWLNGLAPRWRNRMLAACAMALCLPPFLVTNCWLHYLGHTGVWHGWLAWDIFSLSGTVWILSLLTWPITVFTVLGAWQRLEAAQLESDPAITGWTLIRGLLLPVARGGLSQGAVLTFVIALNNFAVPAILQQKVFPAEVWVLFNTTFDSGGALKLSWPMILAPLLLLIWFRRREVGWPQLEGTVSPALFRQQLGRGWFIGCGMVGGIVAALSVLLPLVQLASTERTWTELPGAVAAGQEAIWHSLAYAAAGATICTALGLMTWRWRIGIGLWFAFLVPGVLLGIGLITVFNRPGFTAFYESAGIVILALVVRYLAIGWNNTAHALRGMDRDLNDAAMLSGATRWEIFKQVRWPQISGQVLGAWYVIFLLCLWDVESIVLIIPPGGETVALRVFNLLHYGHNNQVNALCLTLLVLAVIPLVLWRCASWFGVLRKGSALAACCAALVTTFPGCTAHNERELAIDSGIFSSVEIIGTRGVGVGQLNKPRSVAVDRKDNLYVVDMTGRVQKFSPDGKFILEWQMPQTDLGKPKGMARDKDGNIIVLEPHYQRLNFFSTEGRLISQWGTHGTNVGQLTLPRSVAVDSHGDIYVSEYTVVDRVQEFSPDGKRVLNAFGRAGLKPGEFNRAEGMGMDAADNLYVADSCNHRIQIFSPSGNFLREYGQAGKGVGDLSYPYDIRIDEKGRQYVCEFGNSRIQIFDAHDQPIETIGGPGYEPGKFSNPWSIALDSKGNLYVADSQNHRVEKFIRRNPIVAMNGKGAP